MGITIIPNQPIMFRNTDEILSDGCECNEQPFCQIVNEVDPTQFQIKASNKVLNPDFEDTLDPWYSILPIQLLIEIININPNTECTGVITAQAVGYTGIASFSINGGAFVDSPNQFFAYENLCEGCGFVTLRDSDGNEASAEYCIVENVVCGDYSLTTDFIDVETIELRNCYTTDFV